MGPSNLCGTPAHKQVRPLRILCLDGGGAKGANLVVMLQAIESRCGRPLIELFDVVCGTSIGSCSGFALTMGLKAEKLLDGMEQLCFKSSSECSAVFPTCSTWNMLSTGSKIQSDVI